MQLKSIVIKAIEDVKGRDLVVLNVSRLTTITDYMIIVSGGSGRHIKSLAENVVEQAKAHGYRPLGVEGERTADWVLVDLGDVVVHIMRPATRDFYKLERLWSAEMQNQDSVGS